MLLQAVGILPAAAAEQADMRELIEIPDRYPGCDCFWADVPSKRKQAAAPQRRLPAAERVDAKAAREIARTRHGMDPR